MTQTVQNPDNIFEMYINFIILLSSNMKESVLLDVLTSIYCKLKYIYVRTTLWVICMVMYMTVLMYLVLAE